MDWFERLTGFKEAGYRETQSRLAIERNRLRSLANGRSWAIGEFEMVSLGDLRMRAAPLKSRRGSSVALVQGDVRHLHADPANAGALFQVASQFNALEMTGPRVTPEDGVTDYKNDATQGPACALAAGPATLFRNYFVPVAGAVGQTRDRQLDGLADLGAALAKALDVPVGDLWTMQNGYAMCTESGLRRIGEHLASLDNDRLDRLRGLLRIAVQRGVEVTAPGAPAGQMVSQAFCSALPIAYCGHIAKPVWQPFASLVLEAAYEATLLEAAVASAESGSNVVFLTLLGGGAFGNPSSWIHAAILRALRLTVDRGLDVRLVSYGSPTPELRSLLAEAKVVVAR